MSNVSMYNLLFNINAGLFLILVIVIIAILQSLYDISEKLMYVICGLLLIVTFEIFLGYWRRKMHKKNNLVKYFFKKIIILLKFSFQMLNPQFSMSTPIKRCLVSLQKPGYVLNFISKELIMKYNFR